MKYSEYLSVVLDTQNVIPMRHIVICGLSGSAVLFHNIPQRERFSKGKKVLNIKSTFCFSVPLCLKHFLF